MEPVTFFYGLATRWTTSDSFYKVHILRDGLAGAYIAGQVYDDESALNQLVRPAQMFAPLMAIWARRIVARRVEREASYESLEPGSDAFLTADRRNFRVEAAEIERVTLNLKRSFWTGGTGNSGTIEFRLLSGKPRRFVLIGEQDHPTIREALGRIVGSQRFL